MRVHHYFGPIMHFKEHRWVHIIIHPFGIQDGAMKRAILTRAGMEGDTILLDKVPPISKLLVT